MCCLLWQRIRGRRLGVVVRRQVPRLGRFTADFLAPAQRLVIEVDGAYHGERERVDARRDAALERAWLSRRAAGSLSSGNAPIRERLVQLRGQPADRCPITAESAYTPESQLPSVLCYRGSIMKKREGVTEKISISLSRSDLVSLKKRAKRLYSGNVSAVISELAGDAALLEGMHELVSWLGGPSLTDRERKAIDREWSGQPRAPKKRSRKSKKAA